MIGYYLTPTNQQIHTVYGDWVHVKNFISLDEVISNGGVWETHWHNLAIIPSHRYNVSGSMVGRRFVRTLTGEL